jgi:hypothetical protein
MKRPLALLLAIFAGVLFSINVFAADFGVPTYTDSGNSAIMAFDPNGRTFDDGSI